MGSTQDGDQPSLRPQTESPGDVEFPLSNTKSLLVLLNQRYKVICSTRRDPDDEWTEQGDRCDTYAYLAVPYDEIPVLNDSVDFRAVNAQNETRYYVPKPVPSTSISISQEHIIQPALLHILILMPLLALDPQCLDLSSYMDNRLFPCSMTIGPLLTASASLMHYLSKSSIEPASRRNFVEERSRYQISTTLSWALMGAGYIWASVAVGQSAFVTRQWPVSVVATALLPLLLFYWMVGVVGTFSSEGRRFDKLCGQTN